MMSRIAIVVIVVTLLVAMTASAPVPDFFADVTTIPTVFLIRNDSVSKGAPSFTIINETVGNAFVATSTSRIVALAKYNASNSDLGWDYLLVEPIDADKTSARGYYHAGFLEAALTYDVMAYTNWAGLEPTDPAVAQWITTHIQFMTDSVNSSAASSPYWAQIGMQLQQLRGLVDGFNFISAERGNGAMPITFRQVFLHNFRYEVGDVEAAVSQGAAGSLRRREKAYHCSAMVKVTKDDAYLAHVTWAHVGYMVRRVFKYYRFGITVGFSGFPGLIASGDDFYVTSTELSIFETTNMVWNSTLFQYIVPQSVSEFLRVMAASFTAKSGKEWVDAFRAENNGCYNNGYAVLDQKLFSPGAPLQDNLLWLVEQVPGTMESADITDVLRNNSYFASYNIAFFPSIRAISGYDQQVAEFGPLWDHHKYARAKIFRARQGTATDLAGVKALMRYNNFKFDNSSLIPNCSGTPDGICSPRHSAILSIAARGDLNPPLASSHYGPQASWVCQPHVVGFDAKISSWKTRANLTAYAISGPTYDQQPIFRWSTSPYPDEKPAGSVDAFAFPWVQLALAPSSFPGSDDGEPESTEAVVLGCIFGGLGAVLIGLFILRRDPNGPCRGADSSSADGAAVVLDGRGSESVPLTVNSGSKYAATKQ